MPEREIVSADPHLAGPEELVETLGCYAGRAGLNQSLFLQFQEKLQSLDAGFAVEQGIGVIAVFVHLGPEAELE